MNRGRGLYRSRTDSIIGGVAGGIANYLNTDPTYIRIIFALLAVFGGGGVFIYVILWIAIPIEPVYYYENANNAHMNHSQRDFRQEDSSHKPDQPAPGSPDRRSGSLIAGLAMITLGVIFLVDRFVPRIDFIDLWPLVLLVAGIVLVREGYKSKNKKDEV